MISSPVTAAEASDENQQALDELLNELEKKIEDADKRMVAHPKFLDELQTLVDKYKGRLRAVYLSDDFSDGDYNRNPAWTVDAGSFRLTPSRRLWSRISTESPTGGSSSGGEENPVGIILKEFMRSMDDQEGKKSTSVQTEAAIHTIAHIGSAFEIELGMVSESRRGAMEIVLLGGKPATPRYRMIYHAAPSVDRPIEIVRERGSRSYLIDSATQYPDIDDGRPHKLQWMRTPDGRMRVLVDGKEVLSTVEVFYRSDFSGLALINRGGTYEWGPIRALQAKGQQP